MRSKALLPLVVSILLLPLSLFGQGAGRVADKTVEWKVEAVPGDAPSSYRILLTGSILPGYHIYTTADYYSGTALELSGEGFTAGELQTLDEPVVEDGDEVLYGEAHFACDVVLSAPSADLSGTICWTACREMVCGNMEEFDFSLSLGDGEEISAAAPSADNGSDGSLWGLLVEALICGLLMLLTPCVFPMVPMTVSYFLKGSASPAAGRFKALMYGLFIVVLYTLPITVLILVTWLAGGDDTTADIFNWFSTHWIPNLTFFVVFILFAISFFGAFEITLPSSIVNKSDRKADSVGGLGGVFFMALTLVLVSFSCTVPIVGTVLIQSVRGAFWTPILTMFVFSLAFALPFTLLALFPSFLKKMKSGAWLNSVKVVFGFLELALAFKFLSMADQSYHWGILDREVYLAIWIVIFSLLGLYLLGKIRFAHDEPVEHLSIFRLGLVITVFSFVVYMIPGMWGAPLKALSGYLPPLESQDFNLYNPGGFYAPAAPSSDSEMGRRYDLKMPLGLQGYFSIEEGLEASRESGKPVFVDISGHSCANCREMENRVWSDPEVFRMLRDEFVMVALFTDDKSALSEADWVTTDSGKVLKELGAANAYTALKRFGVNGKPNYVILDSDGRQLTPVHGYDLDVKNFQTFLQSGQEAFGR